MSLGATLNADEKGSDMLIKLVNLRYSCWLSMVFILVSCSGASAVKGISKAISTALVTPIDPIALDKAILEAPDQAKFESSVWKNSVNKRRYMLVDFYQLNLLNKSPEEIHALLGEPFRSEIDHTVSEFYDLGNYENRNIFLDVVFFANRLDSLRIGQTLLPGSQYFFASDWHWANPRNSDIANELNQHFYLVGAPVKHLCQMTGQPEKSGAPWCCGSIQLDYTSDQSKVARFRMVADNYGVVYHPTDWQEKDLRINKGSYSTASDLSGLCEHIDSDLTKPRMKFNSIRMASKLVAEIYAV